MKGSVTGSEPQAMIAWSNEIVLLAVGWSSNLHRFRRREMSPTPVDHRDLALLGKTRQAARQLLDDAVLPAAQLVDVDRRRREGNSVIGHLPGFVDHLGGVQQAPSTECSRRSGRRRQASAPLSTSTTFLPRSAARNAAE